jgi:hypothetical protein
MCARRSIIPEMADAQILKQLGVPVYIQQGDRLLVLEMSGGQFRVRMVQGSLTSAEITPLQRRLNELQGKARKAASRAN